MYKSLVKGNELVNNYDSCCAETTNGDGCTCQDTHSGTCYQD